MRHQSFVPAALLAFSCAVTPLAHAAAPKPAAHSQPPALSPGEIASQGVYDLSPLRVFTGKIVQFLLSPNGAVTGFVLESGEQVFVTPEEGHAFAGLAKPGDTVQVRGLKSTTLPIIRAFEVTSAQGRSVRDTFISMPQHSPEMIAGPDLVLHGEIWMPLYTMGGQVAGVILKNHALVHLAPGEATRVAAMLKPGPERYAVGTGSNGAMGTAISARELGPTMETMVPIVVGNAPPPGPAAGSAGYDVIGVPTTH